MGLFWVVRILSLLILGIFVGATIYFLPRREQYMKLLENRGFNLSVVVLWNMGCYLPAILPSDNPFFSAPSFFARETFLLTLSLLGLLAIIFGVTFIALTTRLRKTLGAELPEQGLVTSGPYRFTRHPIYLGIISVAFGFAAVFGSFEGLLCILPIILLNFLLGTVEEIYDVGVRFETEYRDFKNRVRIFGPLRFWIPVCILAGVALSLAALG